MRVLHAAGRKEPNMIDTSLRDSDLRHTLTARRREMQDDVHRRIREGCTSRPTQAGDHVEHADADIRTEIELALLQMKAETLIRVDDSLRRLDTGEYGACVDCAAEISERRLRALPFAVRCQACEEKDEQARGDAKQMARRRDGFSLFPEMVSG
jgi:DnaK suppressor protein